LSSGGASGSLPAALGIVPRDPALFREALTHGSLGEPRDYQRLEFLGDRVLGMVIADTLYRRFGDAREGQMATFLNRLVSRETCAEIARSIDLGPHLRLGKQAREDGGADSVNILGDVVEALIGALYLDAGLDAARGFILDHWASRLDAIAAIPKHPKSALQEWAAARGRRTPLYSLVDRSGPHHDLRFTVRVEIKGLGSTEATGSSKQEAETEAARLFLAEHAA